MLICEACLCDGCSRRCMQIHFILMLRNIYEPAINLKLYFRHVPITINWYPGPHDSYNYYYALQILQPLTSKLHGTDSPNFCRTWRFIAVFTRSRQEFVLSLLNSITPWNMVFKANYNIMLPLIPVCQVVFISNMHFSQFPCVLYDIAIQFSLIWST